MAFEYSGGEGLLFVPVFFLQVVNQSKALLCQGIEEFTGGV